MQPQPHPLLSGARSPGTAAPLKLPLKPEAVRSLDCGGSPRPPPPASPKAISIEEKMAKGSWPQARGE